MIALLAAVPGKVKIWGLAAIGLILVAFSAWKSAEAAGRAQERARAMRREIERRNRQSEKVNEIEGAITNATSSSPAAHHDLIDRLRQLGL